MIPDTERSFMRKFITALLCAFTAVATATYFTACTRPAAENGVNLVAVEGGQVGLMHGVDYYVVPEPAASARVSALKDLNIVGDLQEIYGGENGYPQAVIVAKTGVLEHGAFMRRFIAALGRNGEWLADEHTSAETVVSAVREHLTDGASPMFTAENLTKQVIENCGIGFVPAAEGKREIKAFMEKLDGVSETPFGTPSDGFFHDGEYGADESNPKVSVYAPDGAPALGIANLLAGEENLQDCAEIEYEVVAASLIQTFVTGANPKADICVLPVNLAVKLLGNGGAYKLIGTLTHGNLFLLSENGERITADNFDTLKGKTVGVVNLAAVPGLTFKLILKEHGVEYKQVV